MLKCERCEKELPGQELAGWRVPGAQPANVVYVCQDCHLALAQQALGMKEAPAEKPVEGPVEKPSTWKIGVDYDTGGRWEVAIIDPSGFAVSFDTTCRQDKEEFKRFINALGAALNTKVMMEQ